jgi:hypothetical protein
MPMREKDRKLRKRQRRVGKLRALRRKLAAATEARERARLEQRIRAIDPWGEASSQQ